MEGENYGGSYMGDFMSGLEVRSFTFFELHGLKLNHMTHLPCEASWEMGLVVSGKERKDFAEQLQLAETSCNHLEITL